MEIHNKYSFYVGTSRGVIASTQCKPNELAKFDLQNIDKANEITSLEWGRSEDEIIIGYQNDSTRLYNTLLSKYTHTINNDEGEEGGGVVGADILYKNIIIGHKNGYVNIWHKRNVDNLKLSLVAGATLETMVCNKNRDNVIGTGGERNDFKLWDVQTKKCIFKAKSMGHDELNLPLPTTIRSICFLPRDEKLSACCTKEGYLLLYDERAQRRPVTKFIEPKASYTTLTTAYRETQCIVGTTKGYMQLVDLKSPAKCVKTFKSFTGSVTDIVCDSQASIIASVSLDRHLRIHNMETKELLHKEYLKQNLTKLVMRPVIKDEPSDKDVVAEVADDKEYDELFENMEMIGVAGKSKHKRKSLKDTSNKDSKKVKSVKS